MQAEAGNKKSKNLLIILVVAALVVVGGSASAFFLIKKTPKVQYLMAESESIELVGSVFEDRYKNEMKWMETQKKKPVETTLDLSAEWNDPNLGYDMEEVQSIVNSTTLSMNNVYDPSKKEFEFELGGELGSMAVKFGKIFATPEKLLISLPFSDDLIRFDDNDFGRLMSEVDEDFEGNEDLGLARLFEGPDATSNELTEHLKKEYVKYLINELPEKAFTSEKEAIEVYDEKIDAKKLSMNLSEEEVKTLIKNLLKKVRDDEKLKEMMKEQVAMSSFAGNTPLEGVDDLFDDFEKDMNEMIEDVDTLSIPNGIQSTIWHHSNRIVKRDFAMAIAVDSDEKITFEVDGVQLFEETNQKWDYAISAKNSYYEETNTVDFTGDLTWENKQADDSMEINFEGMSINYNGEEELDGKERTFTRTFGFTDGVSTPKFVWSGDVTHEKDSVKANHKFSVDDGLGSLNLYGLNLKQQGKIVKKVDMPKETNSTVILKEMEMSEIEDYIVNDLGSKIEIWMTEVMGDLEKELYD